MLLLLFRSTDWPSWSMIALRYMEYVGYFLVYGALGFHWLVHRSISGPSEFSPQNSISRLYKDALRRSATVGVFGAVVLATELLITGGQKVSSHANFFAAAGPKVLIQLAFAIVALFAFIMAARKISIGWTLGWIAGAAFVLRNSASHKWTGPVNPLHEAGAAVWLGTLLMILAVALPTVMRSGMPQEERSKLIARLIRRFSAVALAGASLMLVTGVVTSWTHLKFLAALWTTSYGVTLCTKLGAVVTVVGLGAWNWKRVAPALEVAPSVNGLRRIATAEVLFGAIVLLITAVLVLLPSPTLPKS